MRRIHQLDEKFALTTEAIGKGQLARSLNGLDTVKRGQESTLLFDNALLEFGEQVWVIESNVQCADLAQGPLVTGGGNPILGALLQAYEASP